VSEAADRPEHIDLAKLVAARQALQAALEDLTERPSQRAMATAQDALRQLPLVSSDRLWESLEAAARLAEQGVAAEAPTDPTQRQAAAWRLVEDVLAGAGSGQLAEDIQQVLHAGQVSRVVPVARVQVEAFVDSVERFADQERPAATDEEASAAWMRVAKVILEKAYDLLTDVAVAAVFTVTAVQVAAQRATLGVAELAGRAVSQLGPAVPLLLGITTVAAEAAMGVGLIRDIWHPFDPTDRPDAIGQPRQLDRRGDLAGDPRQPTREAFSDTIDAELEEEPRFQPGSVGIDTRQVLGPVSDSWSATEPTRYRTAAEDFARARRMSREQHQAIIDFAAQLDDHAMRQVEGGAKDPTGRGIPVGRPYWRAVNGDDDNRDEAERSSAIQKSRRQRETAHPGISRHEGPGWDREPRTNPGRPSRADDH
jgi:hypothetical protein